MISSNQNNRNFSWIFLLMLSITIHSPLFSQITITQQELKQIFTVGNPLYVIGGDSVLINIGNYNGPNEYDFTQVDIQYQLILQNFDVGQIPALAVRYLSSATTMGEGPQNIVENPIFLWNTDSTFFLGEATVESEYRFLHYVPYELFATFPIEFNPPSSSFTQWITVYDTTYNLNWQVKSTDQYNTIVDVWIDGYGTLKLPGMELECLRMTRAYSWFQYKEFLFITKEGIFLVVSNVPGNAPDTGYVLADYSLLSTDSITSVHYYQTTPLNFNLGQNFPNPFNPRTIIKYQIPELSFATLIVYDVLGNEVAILTNEEKPAGEYEVEFNGKGLTSGVYFYKLKATPSGVQAGSFVETKKMILIK
jgi:hypothetical protein